MGGVRAGYENGLKVVEYTLGLHGVCLYKYMLEWRGNVFDFPIEHCHYNQAP
jgi:hypothetical protein